MSIKKHDVVQLDGKGVKMNVFTVKDGIAECFWYPTIFSDANPAGVGPMVHENIPVDRLVKVGEFKKSGESLGCVFVEVPTGRG